MLTVSSVLWIIIGVDHGYTSAMLTLCLRLFLAYRYTAIVLLQKTIFDGHFGCTGRASFVYRIQDGECLLWH